MKLAASTSQYHAMMEMIALKIRAIRVMDATTNLLTARTAIYVM
jgi:hypothetical protein